MKTTIDISDPLLKEAKNVAHREGTTVRAIVERGLQLALGERRNAKRFRLRDGSVAGSGLHPEATGLSHEQMRERSYEGRGG
ncbi:MAG: DUF2191 domain-containing protein [Pseudomonadota bacterium]